MYRDDNDLPISPKNKLHSPSKKKTRVAQVQNDFTALFSALSATSNSVAGKTNDSSNCDEDAASSVGSVSIFAPSERPRLFSKSSEEITEVEQKLT